MLRRLEYFVTAAEMGSFTKAAEKLFVTQPALSKGIIHLEKELGAPLFVRGSRQVLLTRAGTVCLKQARELLRQAEVLREAVAFESEQLRGALNIGYLIYGHLNAIGPDIYGFTQLHPQVTVNSSRRPEEAAQRGTGLLLRLPHGSKRCRGRRICRGASFPAGGHRAQK